MELTIGSINLGECVISAKRSKVDGGEVQMRTLSGNMVSQYMYKKFVYEFEVDITISQTNDLYDLVLTPFQTVTYGKNGWNTSVGVVCHIEVEDEDDGDLWKYQPLTLASTERMQTVKIRCEEQ